MPAERPDRPEPAEMVVDTPHELDRAAVQRVEAAVRTGVQVTVIIVRADSGRVVCGPVAQGRTYAASAALRHLGGER